MKIKRLLAGLTAACMITALTPVFAKNDLTLYDGQVSVETATKNGLLAFPGAEGGGKYTTGARGVENPEVYHVTNLNENGAGSFADAVSQPGRIIVFDVSGTINLSNTLNIPSNNLTILGQTAPGDGITFAGSDLLLSHGVSNVILRYLKIRPTDDNEGEPDGLGGRWNHNIIIDHCSVSWSVDEMLTLYAGSSEKTEYTPSTNITMQNTIGAESLRMSDHFKGAHGYGAIWGGGLASYHHNLLAHHDSRSPRMDRELVSTDVRNNIIYDWGITNSAYGAEPYSYNYIKSLDNPEKYPIVSKNPSNVNWVNNYYKFGPGTKENLRSRIYDISNDLPEITKANFYINGNYVTGNDEVTSDNWKGINFPEKAEKLSSPVNMDIYDIKTQTAQEAYEQVLAESGATLSKRDSIDARVVADVKNGTGRIINNANEVGGIIKTENISRVFEIPSDWKTSNNMGTAKETDIIKSGKWTGYTWIEAYVNDWTEKQPNPENPDIIVTEPAIQSLSDEINGHKIENGNWAVLFDNEQLSYKAIGIPPKNSDTSVVKMELYDGAELIKTYDNSAEINDSISLAPGIHYLSSKAYNNKKESTQSPTSIVYVKSSSDFGTFEHTQIGKPSFDGKGGSSMDIDGTYTISGSGLIGGTEDSCDFMYKQVTGDFDITAKIVDIPKYENGQISGLMLRESLDNGSKMVMLADGWLKYGENVRAVYRTGKNQDAETSFFRKADGSVLDNAGSYDTSKEECRVPQHMRMQRTGNTITLSVSDDGKDWTNNPRQPQSIEIPGLSDTIYVGIATDSIQGVPVKDYFSQAKYSNIILNGNTDALNELYYLNNPVINGNNVKASIINKGETAFFIAASYDENGNVLDAELREVKGQESPTEIDITLSPDNGTVKTFLWSNNFETCIMK